MRRRQGFTLVELLVAMALILLIMMILSETFAQALKNFRTLKSIGDMEERLRAVATVLRRDLQADHFEGRRRTSDDHFWNSARDQGGPTQCGFFRVFKGASGNSDQEGMDDYGITSRRAESDVLHFAIKLRGNQLKDFAQAGVAGTPLAGSGVQTTFFQDQLPDARYNATNNSIVYSSQWAEVAYFMIPTTSKADTIPPNPNKSTQLYALYRSQFIVVPDNSTLNKWPYNVGGSSIPPSLYEISCQPGKNGIYFNSPNDLAGAYSDFDMKLPRRRAFQWPSFPETHGSWGARGQFDPKNPAPWAATLLATDVLSFDVQFFWSGQPYNGSQATQQQGYAPAFSGDLQGTYLDAMDATAGGYESVHGPGFPLYSGQGNPGRNPLGLRITVRIWDQKTSMARQMTIVQDM